MEGRPDRSVVPQAADQLQPQSAIKARTSTSRLQHTIIYTRNSITTSSSWQATPVRPSQLPPCQQSLTKFSPLYGPGPGQIRACVSPSTKRIGSTSILTLPRHDHESTQVLPLDASDRWYHLCVCCVRPDVGGHFGVQYRCKLICELASVRWFWSCR